MADPGDDDAEMGRDDAPAGAGTRAGAGAGAGAGGGVPTPAARTPGAGARATRPGPDVPFMELRRYGDLHLVPCAVEGKVIRCANGSVYMVIRTLRECIYGKVRAAAVCKLCPDGLYRQTEEIVALKIMSKERIRRKMTASGVAVSEDPDHELRIMQYLFAPPPPTSPYLLRLVEAIHNSDYLIAVLEYAPGGELYDAVTQSPTRRFEETAAKYFFKQLMLGVAFMHNRGIAHRDLSLENMLIAKANVGKTIDFGLGVEMPRTRLGRYALLPPCGQIGKLFYMSPEIVKGNVPYWGHLTDVWSCGIMLFIMLTGAPPFKVASSRLDDRFRLVASKGLRALLQAWKMESLFSAAALDLVSRILVEDPLRRPTAFEILCHPWLGGPGMPTVLNPFAARTAADDDLAASKIAEAEAKAKELAAAGVGGKEEEVELDDDDMDMGDDDDDGNPAI